MKQEKQSKPSKQSEQAIPKILHCIWIGDESKRPDVWLKTWRDKHPDWEYILWGNKELHEHDWQCRGIIEQYLKEERYPGVADVMRYQILYDHGGFVHPADSVCLEPIDDLFNDGYEAYAVYENEAKREGYISPLYASKRHGSFAKLLLDNLPQKPPLAWNGTRAKPSKAPVQVTGNLYMKKMVDKYPQANLKLLPSYTFTPVHYTGEIYQGDEKVYAVQMWGTTGTWLGKEVDYLDIWRNRLTYTNISDRIEPQDEAKEIL